MLDNAVAAITPILLNLAVTVSTPELNPDIPLLLSLLIPRPTSSSPLDDPFIFKLSCNFLRLFKVLLTPF